MIDVAVPLHRTALHEAGHAVGGLVAGARVDLVTIIPADVDGRATNGHCRMTSPCWQRLALGTLTGPATSERFANAARADHGRDYAEADRLLELWVGRQAIGSQRHRDAVADVGARARLLVWTHRAAIFRVAESLVQRRTLAAPELAAIVPRLVHA